jgi:hypothetical protein
MPDRSEIETFIASKGVTYCRPAFAIEVRQAELPVDVERQRLAAIHIPTGAEIRAANWRRIMYAKWGIWI